MSFAFNHLSGKAAIFGEVDNDGVVSFAVRVAKDSRVRGAEMFRRMLIAFGSEAKAIHAVWRKYIEPSSNIDRVNELTAAGLPLADAIDQTWTVRQAEKGGFSRRSVIGLPKGTAGAYLAIDVLIER